MDFEDVLVRADVKYQMTQRPYPTRTVSRHPMTEQIQVFGDIQSGDMTLALEVPPRVHERWRSRCRCVSELW